MKVLMIRSTGGLSGAEKMCIYLGEELKRQYNDLKLSFLTNYSLFGKKIREYGIQVEIIDPGIGEIGTKRQTIWAIFLAPYFIIRYIWVIKKLEKGEMFNIICLHSMTEKLFLTTILKMKKYRTIWIEHGPLFLTNRAWIIKKIYIISSKSADAIVAVSEDTKHDLILGGILRRKVHVIHNGIPIASHLPPHPGEKIIIGYVGGVNKEKGIIEFINISVNIIEKNKNIKFLVVGDGSYYDYAKQRVSELKIEQFYKFTGFQKNIQPYLDAINIFFFPTNHYEGLSLALLEAAAMECLIVAHDIGGNREIVVDGETGFLYKDFDAGKVSKLLLKLIDHYDDYEQIRKNARKLVVEKYDSKIMAKKFYDLMVSL